MDHYSVMSVAIFTLLLLSSWLILSLRKALIRNTLFKKVSWCIAGSTGDYYDHFGNPCYGTRHLTERLFYRSDAVCSNSAYQINIDNRVEYDAVEAILSEYKKDLSHAFFQNRLSSHNLRKMTDVDYFLLTLDRFLTEHEHDNVFCDYEMRRLIESKHYEGGSRTDTCYLTPFGIVYTKLHYFVHVRCILTPAINTNHIRIDSADYLKEKLETGVVQISYIS